VLRKLIRTNYAVAKLTPNRVQPLEARGVNLRVTASGAKGTCGQHPLQVRVGWAGWRLIDAHALFHVRNPDSDSLNQTFCLFAKTPE
jgi:hypothetical protein